MSHSETLSSEVQYEDGTGVPQNLANGLPLINDGDFVAIVYKNGFVRTERIVKCNDGLRWNAGGIRLMTAQYSPFKVTFHDKDILTIVNVSLMSMINLHRDY